MNCQKDYWSDKVLIIADLFNFFQPSIDAVKGPFIGDVIHQEYTLSTPGVRPNDRAESTLARRIP